MGLGWTVSSDSIECRPKTGRSLLFHMEPGKTDIPVAIAVPVKQQEPVRPWNDSCCGCAEDELCGCCTDPCTCCAVCFCPFVTISQLYERVVAPGKCMLCFIILFGCLVSANICSTINTLMMAQSSLDTVTVSTNINGGTVVTNYSAPYTVWSFLTNLFNLGYVGISIILLIEVRAKLRHKDRCDASTGHKLRDPWTHCSA